MDVPQHDGLEVRAAEISLQNSASVSRALAAVHANSCRDKSNRTDYLARNMQSYVGLNNSRMIDMIIKVLYIFIISLRLGTLHQCNYT